MNKYLRSVLFVVAVIAVIQSIEWADRHTEYAPWQGDLIPIDLMLVAWGLAYLAISRRHVTSWLRILPAAILVACAVGLHYGLPNRYEGTSTLTAGFDVFAMIQLLAALTLGIGAGLGLARMIDRGYPPTPA